MDDVEFVYILQIDEPYGPKYLFGAFNTLEAAKTAANAEESDEWVFFDNSKTIRSFDEWTTIKSLETGWTITKLPIKTE